MADLSGIRSAVEDLAGKIETLRTVITAIKGVNQTSLDDIQARIVEITGELDDIINEAKGTGETPPEEPPAESDAVAPV